MTRQLVRIKSLDLGIEDHGILTVSGELEWENGGCSGFPDYAVDAAFLYRLLGALGVESIAKARGKSCWFLYENEDGGNWGYTITKGLLGIAPLHAKDGKPFMLDDWRRFLEKMPKLSASELRGDK